MHSFEWPPGGIVVVAERLKILFKSTSKWTSVNTLLINFGHCVCQKGELSRLCSWLVIDSLLGDLLVVSQSDPPLISSGFKTPRWQGWKLSFRGIRSSETSEWWCSSCIHLYQAWVELNSGEQRSHLTNELEFGDSGTILIALCEYTL